MKLPLRARTGEVVGWTIIDDDDADLAAFTWRRHSKGYAWRKDGGRVVYLHRVIGQRVHGDVGQLVHHRNEDKADNRRGNLEPQSRAGHVRLHFHGRGRFISFNRRRGMWWAYTPNPKRSLGYYETEDAALAAVEVHLATA